MRLNAKTKAATKKSVAKSYSEQQKEKNMLLAEKKAQIISEQRKQQELADYLTKRNANLYNENDDVFVRTLNVIHDKSCIALNGADNDIKIPLERYDRTLEQCDSCALRSYIRMATDNYNAIKVYEKIFLTNRISKDFLRYFFLECGIKINAENYELLFDNNGEHWKIIFDEDVKKPILYHNNYYITDEGKRECTNTYHRQFSEELNLYQCMQMIINYSYDKHLKKQEQLAELEETETLKLQYSQYQKKNKVDKIIDSLYPEAPRFNIKEYYSKNIVSSQNEIADFYKSYELGFTDILNEIEQELNGTADKFTLLTLIAELTLELDNLIEQVNISAEDVEVMKRIIQKYSN